MTRSRKDSSGLLKRVKQAPSIAEAFRLLGEAPGLRSLRLSRYRRFFEQSADGTAAHLFFGTYPSFQAARDAAPKSKSVGYDNPEPAGAFESMLRIHPRDSAIMFWLQRLFSEGATSVLDFGGHVGVKYYCYADLLQFPATLSWTVRDVPAVVAEGKTLAAARSAGPALKFVTGLEQAQGIDVLLAIGSIQYVEQGLPDLLKAFPRRIPWLLVNSAPLYDGPDIVTLQNIGTAFCPYGLFNKDKLLSGLRQLGYSLVDEWQNPEVDCHVPFADIPPIQSYSGF